MSEIENNTNGVAGSEADNNSGNDNAANENENLNTEGNQNQDADGNIDAGADDNGSDANADAENAPEGYDFSKLKLPEGVEIDTELAEKFAPIGKKLNLSQQDANELANLLVESLQKQGSTVTEQFAALKKQEREATKLSYQKMLNTDAEIGGGDTEKMDAYLDVADVGYNSFATNSLQKTLQNHGLDYHPDVVKLFYRLGKLCGNDKVQNAKIPAGTKQDPADVLYGQKDN